MCSESILIPLDDRRLKRSYNDRGPFDNKHSRTYNRNVSPRAINM